MRLGGWELKRIPGKDKEVWLPLRFLGGQLVAPSLVAEGFSGRVLAREGRGVVIGR